MSTSRLSRPNLTKGVVIMKMISISNQIFLLADTARLSLLEECSGEQVSPYERRIEKSVSKQKLITFIGRSIPDTFKSFSETKNYFSKPHPYMESAV